MTGTDRAWRAGVAVAAIVVCAAAATARGAIGISPAYVEVKLGEGRPAGQFIISNMGEEEERYRVTAVHFTFLKDGGLREIPPDDHSMAAWIKFSPTEFVLAPKTRRVIRFVILPRGQLRPGEYWAGMELESLRTVVGQGKDAAGREFKLEVIPTILVPLFGSVGEISYKGEVKDVKVVQHQEKGSTVEILVANSGDGRILLTGSCEIINPSGEVVENAHFGRSYVLRGTERSFVVPLKGDMPEGKYTVRVKCEAPELKEPLRTEMELDWKPPPKPDPDQAAQEPAGGAAEKRPNNEEGAKTPVTEDPAKPAART